MDKKFLLAIALSLGVILVWNVFLFPPPRPLTGGKPGPASGSPTTVGAEGNRPSEANAAPSSSLPSSSKEAPSAPTSPPAVSERIEAETEEERTIETDLYRVRFSNRGARVLSWQLKKWLDDAGKPLDLVSIGAAKSKRFPLDLELSDPGLSERIRQAPFRMEVETGKEGSGSRIEFRYSDGAGLSVRKRLELEPASYVSRLSVDVRRGGEPIPGALLWGAGFGPETGLKPASGERNEITRAVILRDGRIVRLLKDQLRGKPLLSESGSLRWAGLEDHYFAALILPDGGSPGADVRLHSVIEEGRDKEFLSLAVKAAPFGSYLVYAGPKDHQMLASLHLGIETVVDFGWFGAIAQALFFLLRWINQATGNWGWSIILLTCVIRVAFFPLTQRGSVSMRRTQEKMKKIQPRIQAIRERYRKMKKDMGNRQKMNEEIMALYAKEGMNPMAGMSGCLPLLLQLPILWGFYNLLVNSIELRHAPFGLWIMDLSKKDPYYVTPIVMGITMLIQQVMTGSSIPDPAQRRIMMLMPIMFTWFFKDLPSGLVLYWLVNNILAIGQQYLINAQVARESAGAGAAAKT